MYAPATAIGPDVGDVEVFPHGDQIHLFHLTLPNHDVVQHAVSDDGLTWRPLPAALRTGDPGACDDDMIWTMSVTEREGRFYMLYTALSQAEGGRVQRNALAISDDLLNWRKHGDRPVAEADGRWYEADLAETGRVSWRDPKPILVGDTYYATVNGRVKDGPLQRRGCAALMASRDLIRWEVRPPLYAPGRYWDLECPQVFTIDGHYYLTSAIMEDRLQHYWQADDFTGPYSVPADGGVLVPAGHYAGRVCHWQGRDLFFCWHRADYDWPGNRNSYGKYVPAPLVLRRRNDGTLRRESYPGWRAYQEGPLVAPRLARASTMRGADLSDWRVVAPDGMDQAETAEESGDFLLEGRMTPLASRYGLGFRLNGLGGGYYVEFNAESRAVSLQKWLVPTERVTYGYRELQRGEMRQPLRTGEEVAIRLLVVGPYIEVEVDGDVILATLSQERDRGRVGIWCEGGSFVLREGRIAPMRRPHP